MKKQIRQALLDIESQEDVTILYACESGSRAWGFASSDSDFDVRFIYLRRPSWYLSVDFEHRRDVIERPIEDLLDVNGWDLRKALKLLRKSNPPLIEWLGSPIVYRESLETAARLRALLPTYYSSTASGYHYLHMARGNFREFLKGGVVWRKKYFYVLRPILAINWVERGLGVVPTEFQKLLDELIPAGPLREAIDSLVEVKSTGGELDEGPRIPEISNFLEQELERLEGSPFDQEPKLLSFEPLNELFLKELKEIHPNI